MRSAGHQLPIPAKCDYGRIERVLKDDQNVSLHDVFYATIIRIISQRFITIDVDRY